MKKNKLNEMFLFVGYVSLVPTLPYVEAASFDCARARARVEQQICASPTLSTLDEKLARYYRGALEVLAPARECLRADQQQWLQRRNRCEDTACLEELYRARLAELDALQPGANALKDVELPAVPALMWIVPRAQDEIAVPRTEPHESHTLHGRIIDRIDAGGDLELVTADGEHVPLTMLMTADPASIDRLSELARMPALYSARGVLASDETGARHFDPAHCVLIHREQIDAER